MKFIDLLRADLNIATGSKGTRAGMVAWLTNPGFHAVSMYRLCSFLQTKGFRRLAVMLSARTTRATGCHLQLDARIGAGLMLPHPVGIVVGSGCKLGRDVTLYQNVTIGRNIGTGRYPEIGDRVTIYPNSVVSGGISVGEGAVIGAGSIVRSDVPAGAVVNGNPARLVTPKRSINVEQPFDAPIQ